MRSKRLQRKVMEYLFNEECKPCDVGFWGQKYHIKPAGVDEIFGDGMKLVGISPLNTRPNYYVVRVDSSWDLYGYEKGEQLRDHLDEIYDAIEGQYGSRRYCSCEPENDECEICGEWPAFCNEGSSWFDLE